ncbi:ABC transporter substrate-binding protein [Mesorhizobium sp. M1A.F.Ca.ET.072.01.1.1]|uniref:ABC transporter substrate-binding protein n=1 Tax=Mesorhizobium sp. M1A.F.Ca.ET.072.01.1.1 TaxID=2496753 RepID=UPI000FD1A248|nr:ABC transporter substrate-binding protein [Mesorhizobium sp. M1A.F.Ca.ET.072.01.1.1]RUW54418.1 ABC transporter substrate-binding protein [Mesorhizobium sp. M1A.F.Ca.ET.072.01.1.1]TIV04823.1 MAG: ABC transporter substrate-binding protein [Mesorhizobium sp.]
MQISRRDLIKLSVSAGAALSNPSILRARAASAGTREVRLALDSVPSVFDPHITTSADAQWHGMAIYDSLFAFDSKQVARPQMIGNWGVSEDRLTYTFALRDGLGFHDGTPVTAADCVASIRRWGAAVPGGKLLMERTKDVSKKDDKTFTIVLREPFELLIDALAVPIQFLAVMRERDANLPPTQQVTANIGSGPFKFNHALAKPGASFTYDRNEKYVPRSEAPDALAGGKIAKVDRAIWENISDQQTAVAALQAGEIDLLLTCPPDFYSAIEGDPNLQLQTVLEGGYNVFARVNFLQPPFDNAKARQALLHLVDQDAFLKVMAPDPRYTHPVTSMFGNGSPYSNDENTGWYKKGGDPEKARQLFKDAGYAGEKVVILDSTDWAQGDVSAQLLASELKKIGINAELAPSDWAGIVARRSNKGPIEGGGWNILISSWPNGAYSDPIGISLLQATGDKAWFGWPKNDEYEQLRAKWADVATDERKALARKMQHLWWDMVGCVFLGQVVSPSARRKTLTGVISNEFGVCPMWNMEKA